jgi:hypothetical protein
MVNPILRKPREAIQGAIARNTCFVHKTYSPKSKTPTWITCIWYRRVRHASGTPAWRLWLCSSRMRNGVAKEQILSFGFDVKQVNVKNRGGEAIC